MHGTVVKPGADPSQLRVVGVDNIKKAKLPPTVTGLVATIYTMSGVLKEAALKKETNLNLQPRRVRLGLLLNGASHQAFTGATMGATRNHIYHITVDFKGL